MWSFYGSKTMLVDHYPAPVHDIIIEPFAGAAKYALKYWENDVNLIDKDENIIDVWKFLQLASEDDILGLPRIKRGQTLDDFNLSRGERLLMGFIIAKGGTAPRITPSKRATVERPLYVDQKIREIASNLFKIKHWHIRLGTWEDVIPIARTTYFIDPPYQFGGHAYRYSNKNIDFKALSDWCRGLPGQVIVCENSKADWLPFKPLKLNAGSHSVTMESIWTNEPIFLNNHKNKQMSILKNGYFKVTKTENGEFHVVIKGANNETLNQTEGLKSWEGVKRNILATIRAANGKNAVVVDATLLNLEKKKLYYKIQESGTLKQVTSALEDDELVDKNQLDLHLDQPEG